MAEKVKTLSFDAARLEMLLAQMAEMAGHPETAAPLPFSGGHDELDAVAYAVNVLLGELRFANEARTRLETRRAEELQAAKESADAANAAKSAFLSYMSHELRTPVAVLVASAELMAKKKLTPSESAEMAERFLRGAHQVLGLVDTVLDLAKIEAGRIDVRAVEFAPQSLVSDTRLSFALPATAKGLALRFEMGELPNLRGDAQRIRQVLFNLVSNAIKYTPAGTITVAIRVASGAAGHTLHVSVSDTGRGIGAGDRERLFQPFERLPDADGISGTGLGLHLSSRLAAALGGGLTLLSSELGKGSRFELAVPVEVANVQRAPASEPRPAEALRGIRILLADDHADIRRLFGELLSMEGATVSTAGDGQAALNMALKDEYDIVLLDVQMPGLSGLEAVEGLRRRGYTKPVLALTANATRDHRAACLERGFSGFIAKPVDIDAFVNAIVHHAAPK